jgi:hypothetical protein
MLAVNTRPSPRKARRVDQARAEGQGEQGERERMAQARGGLRAFVVAGGHGG